MKEQFEWSESGTNLLQNLYKLIESIGSSEGLSHYLVTENPEYFRNWEYHRMATQYFRNKNRYVRIGKHNSNWTKTEIDLVRANLNLMNHELYKLFPRRTYKAILFMKYKIQRNMVKKLPY